MLDAPTVQDGDSGFTGIGSRLNPALLDPGTVQMARNVRFDRGAAQTRKGCTRLATGLAQENAPVTLPVDILEDEGEVTIADAGTAAADGIYRWDSETEVNGKPVFVKVGGGAQTVEYDGSQWVLTAAGDPATYLYRNTAGADPWDETWTDDGDSTGSSPAPTAEETAEPPTIRDTYEGGTFAAAAFATAEASGSLDYIAIAGAGSLFICKVGEAPLEIPYPSSPGEDIQPGDIATLVQAADRLYLFRERPADTAPTPVATLIETAGTATATFSADHGFGEIGETVRIRISGSDKVAFNQDFDAEITDDDELEFPCLYSPGTSGGTPTAKRVLAPLYWDGSAATMTRTPADSHPTGAGYRRLPAAGWATYASGQLITTRDLSEVLISDILDPDTFDPLLKSFRATAGGGPRIVAIHPWMGRQFLIFCWPRNIYLAEIALADDGQSIDPATSSLTLLTEEIGLIARRSVATAGSNVLFMAGSGVYRLDTGLDLKLRGNTQPLSAPIQDLMDAIPDARKALASACYWNNRYHLAIPAANGLAQVFVYSMLSNQWESIDDYPIAIDGLFLGYVSGTLRLCAYAAAGDVFVLDDDADGNDETASGATVAIASEIQTRRYLFGSTDTKRLIRASARIVLDRDAAVSAAIATIDPEASIALPALANPGPDAADYTLRARLRAKCQAATFTINTTAGRPIIESCNIEAVTESSAPEARTKQ